MDQPYYLHGAHNVWFDENKSRLSSEDNYTPVSLKLQRYVEDLYQNNPREINLVKCELDFSDRPFADAIILI